MPVKLLQRLKHIWTRFWQSLLTAWYGLLGIPRPRRLALRHLTVAGQRRSYYFYDPAPAGPGLRPLLMVFHGGMGHGLRIARQTGFMDLADRHGFAVAYPNALGHWEDGRASLERGGQDIEFVRRLMDRLVQSDCVDPDRIYAVGMSNGGAFSLRLACELSERITAFASVAAAFPADYRPPRRPERPVPLVMINGTADRLIPWGGGRLAVGRRIRPRGALCSVPDTIEFWRRHNGCSETPRVFPLPDIDPEDGTRVQLLFYPHPADPELLQLVRVEGGGHAWPGANHLRTARMARLAGNVCRDIDASEYIWQFFQDRRLDVHAQAEGGSGSGSGFGPPPSRARRNDIHVKTPVVS